MEKSNEQRRDEKGQVKYGLFAFKRRQKKKQKKIKKSVDVQDEMWYYIQVAKWGVLLKRE